AARGDVLPRADDERVLSRGRVRAGVVVRRRYRVQAGRVRGTRPQHGVRDRVPRPAVASRYRGSYFDPDIVDVFTAHAPALLSGLDTASDWDAVVAAEPRGTSSRRDARTSRAGVQCGPNGRASNTTRTIVILPFSTWLHSAMGDGSAVTFVWRSYQVSTS